MEKKENRGLGFFFKKKKVESWKFSVDTKGEGLRLESRTKGLILFLIVGIAESELSKTKTRKREVSFECHPRYLCVFLAFSWCKQLFALRWIVHSCNLGFITLYEDDLFFYFNIYVSYLLSLCFVWSWCLFLLNLISMVLFFEFCFTIWIESVSFFGLFVSTLIRLTCDFSCFISHMNVFPNVSKLQFSVAFFSFL